MHAWGHGLFIDEQSAELTVAGRLGLAKTDLEISHGALAAGALTLSVDAARWSGAEATGAAKCEADLAD